MNVIPILFSAYASDQAKKKQEISASQEGLGYKVLFE